MRMMSGRPLAALIIALAWTGSAAAAPEKAVFTVTNASPRIAYCSVVIDGRARTDLKIRPGKAWADAFDPRRTVQIVCERAARDDGVWRLKAGMVHRLVDEGGKLGIAEGAE